MKPLPRPAQRYVCSSLGCRNGHAGQPAAVEYAEGTYTVEQQVDQLKRIHSWHVGLGRSECAPCSVRHAIGGAYATVTSLESALRASLRDDHERDTRGGTAAVIAGRFGR